MLYMNIFGAVMGALSAVFWCIEGWNGFLAIFKIPSRTFGDKMAFIFRFIGCLPKFFVLSIDLAATIWLTSQFAMGGAWAIGLTISNVISVFLLILTHTVKKEMEEAYA